MEEGEESPFYLLKGMVLVILFHEVGGMNVCCAFPCIVTFRVSFPLDKVLKAF